MKPIGIAFYLALAFILIALIPIYSQNISVLLNSQAQSLLIQGKWEWAALYTIIFSSFLLFLFFPFKQGKWKKTNLVYIAFIIALFAEMFGFPLTIFLLSSFASPTTIQPATELIPYSIPINALGTQFNLMLTSLISGTITIIGVIIIAFSWKQIFNAKQNTLVEAKIYSIMRHPQYFSIMLIATAWLFAWPTIPTIIMFPILIYAYYKLAKREEKELEKKFGDRYAQYKKKTPMILPFAK